MLTRKIFPILLCLVTAGWSYNHPEIEWKTVTSKHFRIHYNQSTEPVLYAAWKIAEEAYAELSELFDYKFSGRIHLSLADHDDFSNGWAMWTERNVMVWVPDLFFDLRGNTTWLRNVITHELAHIMSMEKKKGMQLLDVLLSLDYFSPDATISYMAPIAATTFLPAWFAEGTAQMGAEAMGNDCWDSRRDMVLRCATLEGTLLSLDEMAHFTHKAIGNEQVYNQGYSLAHYLKGRIGEKGITRIWTEARGRRFGSSDFDDLLGSFGLTSERLYAEWKAHLQELYHKQSPKAPTKTAVVWDKGLYNMRPRVSPDGKYWGWLTSHRDDFARTDLVVAKYGDTNEALRVKYARDDWTFGAGSKQVFFIRSRKPDDNGSFLNDIFAGSLEDGTERRLTRGGRVYRIAASPDGKTLACVRYDKSVFSVGVVPCEGGEIKTVVAGEAGEAFTGLAYSPTSNDTLVACKLVAGKADLFLVDKVSGVLDPIAASQAQEEAPSFGFDGRLYFSADFDGIFNIYSVSPGGDDLQKHTNVAGGAFYPVMTSKGLVVSEYTASGFRIAIAASSQESYTVPNEQTCVFSPLPTPKGKVRIHAKPYESEYLRPVWELFAGLGIDDSREYVAGLVDGESSGAPHENMGFSLAAGIHRYRSDALAKKSQYMGFGLQYFTAVVDVEDTVGGAATMSTLSRNPFGSFSSANYARSRAQPHDLKRAAGQGWRHATESALTSTLRKQYDVSDSSSADSTTQVQMLPYPLLVTMMGMENRKFTGTFGYDFQMISLAVVPFVASATPYLQFHVARDLYLGLDIPITVMPLTIFFPDRVFAVSAPLWVSWSRDGYYNEDINYNLGGVTAVRAAIIPQAMPFVRTIQQTDISGSVANGTSVETMGAISTDISLFKSFSILRYASLALFFQNSVTWLEEEVEDPYKELGSASSKFAQTLVGPRATFPILRNINRGSVYLDNLYGSLAYTAAVYRNDDSGLDFDKMAVDHIVGGSLMLGTIRDYIFSRRLILSASYNVTDSEITGSLTFLP